MYEYIFIYIVLSLIIIIKITDFFDLKFFPYFFHVHLNILDQVVSSECAIFGPACISGVNILVALPMEIFSFCRGISSFELPVSKIRVQLLYFDICVQRGLLFVGFLSFINISKINSFQNSFTLLVDFT
jgi:hypothetical protein